MIELTIKTLNAENHQFSVPNDYTVQQLKEHIAETIQIPCESQRCIYLGQVLPDDAKLSDRNVHGKVIHVVQRPPPSTVLPNETQTSENGISNGGNGAGAMPGRRFETHTGTMYLGAMAFPSDLMDAGGLAFLHPRTNLSVSRLVVARNLLRRAINIINQLEAENFFGSSEEQSGQSQSHSESGNLSEDISSADNGSGLEQSDVEIRIELPNSHLDPGAENSVPREDDPEIPDHNSPNITPTTESVTVGEPTSENTSSSQTESENVTEGNQRDEASRRRSSRTPMMATVMGAVLHAQVRLIPFMRLLRQYLLQDTTFGANADTTHTEQQVQSLYNSVSELMHYFSHIYHSLSDIMCDFSQPPPRTLRCRPVILEQQHAAVLRGPRRSTIIRSPVVAISRSTSTTPAESEFAATATAHPPEVGIHDADIGTSSVEVVIEEADTTNMQDNHDEGLPESMDTSEPIITPPEDASGHNNASNLDERTAVGGNDSAYVTQPMSEGIFPEGIRINSVEATILAPNDYVGASLPSGPNQRWRAGIYPAEVFQNMFGFLNQFRQTPRSQRPGTGERLRQQNSNSTITSDINQTSQSAENESRQSSNSNTNSETASQPQSNSNERMFEFDITALSRTFDPFLPCRSHHVHPIVSRASGVRNGNSRASTSQNSTAGQTTQPQSSAQTTSQEPRQNPQDVQSEQSTTEDQSDAQLRSRRNEEEGFGIPEISRNVTNLFSNIFPGLSIGNVTIRRSADAHGLPSESDDNRQAPHSARAHIQVTSNLDAMFPGAIQIELDPMMGNMQANTQQSDSYRASRARIATARRHHGNVANNGQLQMSSSTSSNSSSSSSPSSPPTLSVLSSDEDDTLRMNKEDKEKFDEANPSRTIKHLHSMVKKESIQRVMDKNSETTPKKEVGNNYPLYIENQEAVLFDVIGAVMNNISFSDITGDKADIGQLTFSFRQKIRNFLLERRNLINGDKNNLLNSVNILINNDLFRMKNLLDSDCVKQSIDLVSTICKFNQDSVPELIESIVKTDDTNDNELRKFYKKFRFFIARLLTLFVYCISGDDKSTHIRKILGAVVEEAIKSLPKDEELVHWLRKDLINHVISYSKICQSDNLPQFMRQYVVYRLPPVMPVECTVATATISNIGENTLIEQPQPMDVEDVHIGSSSSSEASFASANSDIRNVTNQSANTSAFSSDNRPTVIPVVSGDDTLPEVVLNSEEWHRSIPSDWVPIITRDIHRLRRQGSQPPFSDAYLSGMPSKRRKLVKKGKPNLQENGQLITDNISTAIDAAGLSASVNTITNHVSEVSAGDGNLSKIVKEELKENVRENLVQQADFLPHRFPDSSKYFMDK